MDNIAYVAGCERDSSFCSGIVNWGTKLQKKNASSPYSKESNLWLKPDPSLGLIKKWLNWPYNHQTPPFFPVILRKLEGEGIKFQHRERSKYFFFQFLRQVSRQLNSSLTKNRGAFKKDWHLIPLLDINLGRDFVFVSDWIV